MNKGYFRKICSVKREGQSWGIYDCNDSKLEPPSEKRYFSSAMKKRYLAKRQLRKDIPTVWILVGVKEDGTENYEQVGRTVDIINTLNEIRNNIKDFFYNKGKYSNLKNKNYTELNFYEVDIDSYLNEETIFKEKFGIPAKDEYFERAYYFIRAAYVEGKLGFETKANMYHPSSLDGYFYSYYKNQ